MTGKTARIGLSVAVSALFLGLAVRNVDWAEAAAAFRTANYLYVPPMIVITVWSLFIRAQRWRVFLRGVRTPSLSSLVAATNVGFAANMVLPLRAGEVIRPLFVARREGLPLGALLATILLERIFDMFTILLLFGLAAVLVPFSEQVQSWGRMLTTLAVLVGAVVAVIRWQEDLALTVVRRVCRALPIGPRVEGAVEGFFVGFVKALEVLGSPADFLRAFAWSVYLWLVIAFIYTWGVLAFGLDVPLLVGPVVVMTVIAIAVSVPSAPGYIGSFQLGTTLALAIFGVGESVAIAYSVVLHLAQFVGTIGAGMYSLWTADVSLREVEDLQAGADAET